MKKICILLCLCILLAAAAACGGPVVPEQSAESSEDISVPEEESKNNDSYVKTDALEGRTIRVLSAIYNNDATSDIGDNSENPHVAEALCKAINDRTASVEADYGVTIEEERLVDPKRYNGLFLARVRELVTTNICEYDIFYPCLYDAATMAGEGLLTNLANCEGIRLENSWWSQDFIKNTSVLGTYYLTGDLSTSVKQATGAMYFNKGLFDQYGVSYPYQLVRDKKWTIDAMKAIVKQVNMTEDIDDDGAITYLDKFAVAGQNSNLYYGLYSSGVRIAKIDDDGLPYLSFYDERMTRITYSLCELFHSDDFVSGNRFFNVDPTPMNLLLDAFKSDRCIFYLGGIADAMNLADMKGDFGILPYPMYEEGSEYYSQCGVWSSDVYCIPHGIEDDRIYAACVILDALCAYSVDTCAKAYYDVVLQYQKLRTEEDVEMLKIISAGSGADLGAVYSIGGVQGMLSSLCETRGASVTSNYQAIEGKAKQDIENLIASFSAMQ